MHRMTPLGLVVTDEMNEEHPLGAAIGLWTATLLMGYTALGILFLVSLLQ